MEKPTVVTTIDTGLVQTVRIEFLRNVRYGDMVAADDERRETVIFGVRGHPDPNVPDTYFAQDQVFYVKDEDDVVWRYEVQDVVHERGQVQVFTRRSSV